MVLITLIVVVLIGFAIIKISSANAANKNSPQFVCMECGSVVCPVKVTPGSFGTEIILWIFFIIPGILYSIWRMTAKDEICPVCKSDKFLPVNSPKAQAVIKQLSQGKLPI